MPQVFSGGWFYLFIVVMAVCLARIYFKLRTIQKEAPMDRPVIKVAPVPKTEREEGGGPSRSPFLDEADDLIRKGAYGEALGSMRGLLEGLSPTEDREMRGLVLFRIGACHSRMAAGGDRFQCLLRAGEAIGEAVRLFTPVRFRRHYLRALEALAGLYEDLAHGNSPVENLNQAVRTCETGASAARETGHYMEEAMFRLRAGSLCRQLAGHGEPQSNLRKASDHFHRADEILEKAGDENAVSERVRILKMLGDTSADLSRYYQRRESLTKALSAYEGALEIMDPALHAFERAAVLTDASRVLVDLYDTEKSPAYLRRALENSRHAIEAAREGDIPVSRGLAIGVMGDALTRYAESRDRYENLARAVKLYEAALGILKEGEEPARREEIRTALAETVQKISSMGEEAHGRGGEKA